ncbi:hypothetical protein EMCRGX_G027598 [Ephydatia muelleri]
MNATNESVNKDSEDDADSPCPSEVGVLEDDYVYFRNNIYFKERGCPGQLYIVTRGSASGPTLILNWIPSGGHPLNNGVIPFTTDLGQVEMIRIFCHAQGKVGKEAGERENGDVTSGEMVISSRENKYYVFEFTEGNKLLELIKVLKRWKCFTYQKRDDYHHTFNVYRPQLELSQLHAEEGSIKSVLTEDTLKTLMDAEGRITDEQFMKKIVFFQGIALNLRKEVWPFLLGVYSFGSTAVERNKAKEDLLTEYRSIQAKREDPNYTEDKRAVEQVEKDIVRTDRSHPYYRGEENEHIAVMKNILRNYLTYESSIRYSQGMTDLLAPLLAILDEEVLAFWCFTKLVKESSLFRCTSTRASVEKQLEPLRMLIKLLLPKFYSYLEKLEHGLDLMFSHRWLLVFLKREFSESDTMFIWEACWCKYETKSFHLFICIAIMAIYGQRAMDKPMNMDELMLLFLNTLPQNMPRDMVLTQARGYLHQFTKCPEAHCSLAPIMPLNFWFQSGNPKLTCELCKGDHTCPVRGKSDAPQLDREYRC